MRASTILEYLRSSTGIEWPEKLEHATDEAQIERILSSLDCARDPAWMQAARESETWIGEVLERLLLDGGVEPLWSALTAAAGLSVDLGALAAHARLALDREELTPEDHEILERQISELVAAGLRAFTAVLATVDVLRTRQA